MDIIFTDLDGTLLDRDTYSWEAARGALERTREKGVPVVLVSSKTRAEIEVWRERLDNRHPFIAENGGAAFIPVGYFGTPARGASRRGPYDVMEWGAPYEELVRRLREAARASGCAVRGFNDMTAAEVAALCDLPMEQALLAKQREYDEAFETLDAGRADALEEAVRQQGCRLTRGGRFWHILGSNDKALAVDALAGLYASGGGPIRTIGLGDGLNDAEFLKRMQAPVLIPSPSITELRRLVPGGETASQPGPAGWNEAVLRLIGD
ncbi:MAG: HAD-IIB family hydrolase [Acidobacteria bacterium]|nr:HAD-IIB family hydrolase [Acidobacteriota bacterium]